MKELQLQKSFNCPIYRRDSKTYSSRGFVNIDKRSQRGTHWTAFYIKKLKSYFFGSFGGQPDNILVKQIPEPIIHHNYKIQDKNSKLCGSYCLFFFFSNKRMNYYDTIL